MLDYATMRELTADGIMLDQGLTLLLIDKAEAYEAAREELRRANAMIAYYEAKMEKFSKCGGSQI